MSKIVINETGTDPFKDEVLSIFEIGQLNLVDMGDVYHKTTKIKFTKTEEQNAIDLLPGEIITYFNSSILEPITPQEIDTETPSGTPTYSLTTNRFFEATPKPVEELQLPLFYTREADSKNQRNIVFNSNTPLVGSPEADFSKYQFSNILYMTYPTDGQISNHIQEADRLGDGFSIYERFMVLFGHYSNSISRLTNEEDLTLKSFIDNFNYPFPVDAYYPISNKPIDLSYDIIQQEIFGQIRKTISKNSMDYVDIFKGDENANEYLFFRVEKWFSETAVGTPDQVFFMAATQENKLFIDTQIKENKTYYYRATAYYAVIGQEYFFSDVVDNGDSGECVVNVRPKIRLDNVVIFENTLINIPAPPLPPFVSFHNKMSSEGKVKIYLELQKGEEQADLSSFSILNNKIGPNYNLPNGEVQFKYRKESARFQIYRTSTRPTIYDDFTDNLIGTFQNLDMTENMVVLDSIRPNKKYYYIFRTINEFGSYSNPSAAYEVELLKDADDSRVLVNSILITEEEDSIPEFLDLNFRSLLQLQVAGTQLEFNTEDLKNNEGIIPTFQQQVQTTSLGDAGDSGELLEKIWGRKFKFRVRSNDSGKIIDFNVKVNLIKEESEEDFSV